MCCKGMYLILKILAQAAVLSTCIKYIIVRAGGEMCCVVNAKASAHVAQPAVSAAARQFFPSSQTQKESQ